MAIGYRLLGYDLINTIGLDLGLTSMSAGKGRVVGACAQDGRTSVPRSCRASEAARPGRPNRTFRSIRKLRSVSGPGRPVSCRRSARTETPRRTEARHLRPRWPTTRQRKPSQRPRAKSARPARKKTTKRGRVSVLQAQVNYSLAMTAGHIQLRASCLFCLP